uniref:Peroxisomal membrane protein n=1 Tax=Mycena chlorophos TaxID=658473 RepID=A0ABQ0LHJ2_MYCCL|nr:predicted protein [Mycena chlorophos]
MSAPGYAHLLANLQKGALALPLSTIQGALAHHLATLSPLPTPLAAIVVSSPFFAAQPLTNHKLQALFTAFRHATHIRFQDAQKVDEKRSFVDAAFARALKTRIALWANAVLKGLKGGHPLLRLACCGGLLAGLEDLKVAETLDVSRSQIEDEVVISVAEVMDLYSGSGSSWETEFRPTGDIDRISLALIFAAQSLVLVAPGKLKALPLALLLDLLTFTITTTFASGAFLNAQTLRRINDSPLMNSIAPLAKLTALVISVLCDSRPAEGAPSTLASLEAFLGMAKTIERGWQSKHVHDMTLVWTTLKTFLFAHIMVAEAALSVLAYVPPSAYSSPSSLALPVLHTLHRLSFVVSQFGGVSTAAQPGFAELRKAFYLALDLLAEGSECDHFVKELVADDGLHRSDEDNLAKTAYELTCIEQLVPVLSDECIQSCALPLAIPFLSAPAHRETYESAHSLVLAVFAAHADRNETQSSVPVSDAEGVGWVARMVPFYAVCLIENSVEDRLSTAQLRLAYAALVRAAGTIQDALAWYCVDVLENAIQEQLAGTATSSTTDATDADKQRHRLHLTLISIVPSVPPPLLPRVLAHVGKVLRAKKTTERKELFDATFVEISERVGDAQRELVMRWWYEVQGPAGSSASAAL